MTVREIAAALGRTETALHVRANKLGLKSRHRTGVNSVVSDYFRLIDTPMKAYVLGLLTADAYVSAAGQLILALHEKDRSAVEAVRDEIAPGARIGQYSTRTTPMCRFSVTAPEVTADLARHGVVRAKSLITAWPQALPAALENSYVCGYFDGDGSMSIQRDRRSDKNYRWAVVSGNPEFLREMQARILAQTGLKTLGPYQDRRHEAARAIVAIGTPARTLDAWMHRDVPGLERKRLPVIAAGESA